MAKTYRRGDADESVWHTVHTVCLWMNFDKKKRNWNFDFLGIFFGIALICRFVIKKFRH